jgi:hypothetical protein
LRSTGRIAESNRHRFHLRVISIPLGPTGPRGLKSPFDLYASSSRAYYWEQPRVPSLRVPPRGVQFSTSREYLHSHFHGRILTLPVQPPPSSHSQLLHSHLVHTPTYSHTPSPILAHPGHSLLTGTSCKYRHILTVASSHFQYNHLLPHTRSTSTATCSYIRSDTHHLKRTA